MAFTTPTMTFAVPSTTVAPTGGRPAVNVIVNDHRTPGAPGSNHKALYIGGAIAAAAAFYWFYWRKYH